MKSQEQIIIEDLQKFLKENGVESSIPDWHICHLQVDVISLRPSMSSSAFFVYHSAICFLFKYTTVSNPLFREPLKVVPLANPQYREKFLQFLQDNFSNPNES